MLVERTPRSDVRPAEIAAAYVDVAGFLHNAEVDRDVPALGIDPFDALLFLRSAVTRSDRCEHLVHVGQQSLEVFHDRIDFPDEYARVPEEFAALDERARQLQVGLLGERLDLVHVFLLQPDLIVDLYVAVAGGRTVRRMPMVIRARCRSANSALSTIARRNSSSSRIRWSDGVTIIVASEAATRSRQAA